MFRSVYQSKHVLMSMDNSYTTIIIAIPLVAIFIVILVLLFYVFVSSMFLVQWSRSRKNH